MISFDNTTKNYYKNLNRQYDYWGYLYLAKKRNSYNLVGFDDTSNNDKGINVICNDDTITITGTSTANYVCDIPLRNTLSSSIGTITKSFSIVVNDISKNINGIQTSLRDSQRSLIGLWSNNLENKTGTISANAEYFRIEISSGISLDVTFKVMICEGENAIPYEEYGKMIKDYNMFNDIYTNLFDKNNLTPYLTNMFITDFIDITKSTITLNGVSNATLICYLDDGTQYLTFMNLSSGVYDVTSYTKKIKLAVYQRDIDTTQVYDGQATISPNLFNINNVLINNTDEYRYATIKNDEIVATNCYTNDDVVARIRLMDLTNYANQTLRFRYSIFENAELNLYYGTETSVIIDDEYKVATNPSEIQDNTALTIKSDLGTTNYLWLTINVASNKSCVIQDLNIYYRSGITINPDVFVRYNASPFILNMEHCAILSFNFNEKTDIYNTSLQHNSLTLELDNQEGYFTDYQENNILDYLNTNCYVDIFVEIKEAPSNNPVYKVMRMNFDKLIYSDYEKVKLEFVSNLKSAENLLLSDRYKVFKNANNTFNYLNTHNTFQNYIADNYGLTIYTDHENNTKNIELNDYKDMFLYVNDLKTLLLYTSTSYGAEKSNVLLLNNANNNIVFKKLTNEALETILKDYQLEKPSIKKEDTYNGVKYYFYNDTTLTFEQTTLTYKKTIKNTLQNDRETFVYVDPDYKISDITSNDISTSSNITLTLEQNTSNIPSILIYTIEGNIGDEYTIEIEKANIYKYVGVNLENYNIGNVNDSSKLLQINETSCLQHETYLYLYNKKPIKSKVEVKIMGLPYLEIGDTIDVELDDKFIKIVITEIDTNFSEGLIQTIKGYELDWTHDLEYLVPSNNLYPRNDLYPF